MRVLDLIEDHIKVANLIKSQAKTIEDIALLIHTQLNYGGRVLIAGNGGSAADAQHIAAELVGRFKVDRRPLAAIALTTDTSILSAVANDYNYSTVFARQIEAIGLASDVLILLSTSGNSPNILAAAQKGKNMGMHVVGLTGQSGGKLAPYCEYLIKVDHTSSDRIQEVHQLCYHIICELVENGCCTGKIQ